MPIHTRHIATLLSLALGSTILAGCGSVGDRVSSGMADAVPAWAGGLPADAPPRPGTAKYDEFMRERERNRLTPASERGKETKPAPESSSETAR